MKKLILALVVFPALRHCYTGKIMRAVTILDYSVPNLSIVQTSSFQNFSISLIVAFFNFFFIKVATRSFWMHACSETSQLGS